jgi:DNA-binding XRE family transcriptional regulator
MRTHKSTKGLLNKDLKDPYFKELYELDQQKRKIVKPIIAYRIKHKLTQGQLAKKLGVTQQHISKIEGGDFSNIETLINILRHVGFRVNLQLVPLANKPKNRIQYAKH